MDKNQQLFDYISNSQYVGCLDDTQADVGFGSAGQQGLSDVVHFYIASDGEKITAVRFQAYGNAQTLASAAFVAQAIDQKAISIARAINYQRINQQLELRAQNRNSALLCEDALQRALDHLEEKYE